MAFVQTFPNVLVSVATVFTGNLTALACPPGYRIVVVGWNLTVSGAATAIGLRFGASKQFASKPAEALLTASVWSVEEVRYAGDVAQDLIVFGGVTNAVLDGTIEIELVHAKQTTA